MSNELAKAAVKLLVGIGTVIAGGTLINKGRENVKQHQQNQNSGGKK